MGTINKAWHLANRMPKNASDDQRIAWHLAHAQHCTCREPTQGVLALLAKKRTTEPAEAEKPPRRAQE